RSQLQPRIVAKSSLNAVAVGEAQRFGRGIVLQAAHVTRPAARELRKTTCGVVTWLNYTSGRISEGRKFAGEIVSITRRVGDARNGFGDRQSLPEPVVGIGFRAWAVSEMR